MEVNFIQLNNGPAAPNKLSKPRRTSIKGVLAILIDLVAIAGVTATIFISNVIDELHSIRK